MQSNSEERHVRVAEEDSGVGVAKMLRGKPASWSLGLIAFTESSFLPILVDPFLVAMTLAKTSKWARYALIASGWSVLGGVAGYILGAAFFEVIGQDIVTTFGLEQQFTQAAGLFDGNVFWVTLFGAFTPIPYKIFAIVGGLLKVNIFLFVIASIIGRGARFYLVAYITKRFGDHALSLFARKVNVATAAVLVGILLYAVMVFIK